MTDKDARDDIERINTKVKRMQSARNQRHDSPWIGLGMFGLIGWAVAVPVLLGTGLGIWIDEQWPSDRSWVLILLLAGAVLGALNAWYWLQRESRHES